MDNRNENRKEEIELFKQAINEGLARKFEKEIVECQEPIVVSNNHKQWMNRFFREVVGSSFVPYPEMNQ